MKKIQKFLSDESGATAIEYGLLATLIAVAIIGGATALGDRLDSIFNDIHNRLVAADNRR